MKTEIFLICLTAFMAVASSSDKIDPTLQKRFLFGGAENTETVMVSFTKGIQTVFSQINALNISNLSLKRSKLIDAQQKLSNLIQKPLQTFLLKIGINFESFWISNMMVIPNVNSRIVNLISKIPGVAKVETEPIVDMLLPVEESEEVTINHKKRSEEYDPFVSWGVQKIRAEAVWRQNFKGHGIVVAGIDSGVRYTHEALKDNWRQSYGWYDPYNKTSLPNDQTGHGTHTMGTIAGKYGDGVAPEAKWIACKGCEKKCSASALLACGQWVLCPTKPDGTSRNCAMAPNIVSNSWGGAGGRDWYDGVINSWQAAGIVPVFAMGNSGPSCDTVASPADRSNVIAVGNTDQRDRISYSSSLGPAKGNGRIKPDIVAPGSQVVSAGHTGDNSYSTKSGTSMACPHVAGVIALMLDKDPFLNYDEVYKAITSTAVRNGLDMSTARTCGGKGPSSFPNNVFGYGRIDALNAVNAI